MSEKIGKGLIEVDPQDLIDIIEKQRGTYSMQYHCSNCGKGFSKAIIKGVEAATCNCVYCACPFARPLRGL